MIAATLALYAAPPPTLPEPTATVLSVEFYPGGCNPVTCYPAGVEVHTTRGTYPGDLNDLHLHPGDTVTPLKGHQK